MLNSLIHGEALMEILIEGANPYADGPLTEGEQSRLQALGLRADQAQAMAIGRVVQGGRGVWVLDENRLVMLGQRDRMSVDSLPRSAVLRLEAERGRYGHTVRVHSAQARYAMYAVDPARAQALVDALQQAVAA